MSAPLPEPLDPVEYARQVRLALADVAPHLLDELLEDLDEHLAEVDADTGESLQARLGPPGVYAQELRHAAGLAPPVPTGAVAAGRLQELRDAARRLAGHDAVRSVLAFLPELRPAWWVLRGWMAVVALGYLSGYHSLLVPFGVLLGPPLIAAAVVASVRLGRRAVRRDNQAPRQRLVTIAANAGLALVALLALAAVQQQPSPVYASNDPNPGSYGGGGYGGSGGTLARSDGSPITNIYPFSSTGQPLTGVLLYDQDGRALDNLAAATRDGVPIERVLPAGPPLPANAYPQQQQTTSSDPAAPPKMTPQTSPPTAGLAPSPELSASPAVPGAADPPAPGPPSTAGPASSPAPGSPLSSPGLPSPPAGSGAVEPGR